MGFAFVRLPLTAERLASVFTGTHKHAHTHRHTDTHVRRWARIVRASTQVQADGRCHPDILTFAEEKLMARFVLV